MKFLKMHGLGNDFVILDQRGGRKELPIALIEHIADRHFGVGCDQLIVMEPSQDADLFMRIYNPDGSEAQSCGNATRCAADIVMREKEAESCAVETLRGILPCFRADGGLITVDMGPPSLDWAEIPLAEEKDTLHLGIGKRGANDPVAVSMGNPHCVFFVGDAEAVDIETLGPGFETYPLFPERTNVEFAQVISREEIRLRVWERGVGVTLACGSGACAAIVAAVRRGLTERKADIRLDGGILHLEWRESDDYVLMTGPVAYVFQGELITAPGSPSE